MTPHSGRLSTTVKAKKDGCYRFVFFGNGTTTASSAVSSGDCINVR